LKQLSLSFNPLCDGNNLLKFLARLDKLELLNLKSCWLTEKFFQETEILSKSKFFDVLAASALSSRLHYQRRQDKNVRVGGAIEKPRLSNIAPRFTPLARVH